ncbi:PucR family transcriptional regulator [Bifidobacterium platyrrhinorum]|uniref:PucR family transcriptional regulator n=1 Tax=Bifidobacterium platyrrhinorum TaxID=2661628 RepID=A0A6L9SQY2_9BIFI|nr:helix-turn-helix domain-containing protein [Bifidobacterium platyrrhinorum]NEG54966.1 PucR family transcriptional regulator [Bifidobacterium platyrrhinorum]
MTDFLDLLTRDASAADDDGAAARLAKVAFECLASGLSDDRVASLLRALGFDGAFACFAIAGLPAATVEATSRDVTRAVVDLGGDKPLIGVRDGVVAALVRVEAAASPEVTCTSVAAAFDTTSTPICLGPVRHGVSGAVATLGAALTTLRAAPAMPPRPRAATPLRAEEALPERALLGDADARRELVDVVYGSLAGDNPDDPTMLTVSTFLASGGSLETTARTLNVHPNTVRYRLKRAADTTGWDATNPREAYVLTTAIALGRIHAARG